MAEQKITRAGGTFSGSATNGNFMVKTPIGKIEGSYQVIKNGISFVISNKPFLLSCTKIESELKNLIV